MVVQDKTHPKGTTIIRHKAAPWTASGKTLHCNNKNNKQGESRKRRTILLLVVRKYATGLTYPNINYQVDWRSLGAPRGREDCAIPGNKCQYFGVRSVGIGESQILSAEETPTFAALTCPGCNYLLYSIHDGNCNSCVRATVWMNHSKQIYNLKHTASSTYWTNNNVFQNALSLSHRICIYNTVDGRIQLIPTQSHKPYLLTVAWN